MTFETASYCSIKGRVLPIISPLIYVVAVREPPGFAAHVGTGLCVRPRNHSKNRSSFLQTVVEYNPDPGNAELQLGNSYAGFGLTS